MTTRTATRSPDRPVARAAALAVSAVVLYLLVDTGRVPFRDLPLLVGLGYLAGAVAGGRGGALWAPALVVTGWGLGNAALYSSAFADLRLPEAAAHLVGTGLGVLVLAGLAEWGIPVSLTGVGLSVVLSGVLFALQRGQAVGWLGSALNQPWAYAVLLLAYAAAELAGSRNRTRTRTRR